MRISYSWLKEYLPLDLPVTEVADLLTGLGLEVSSVERVESIRGGLQGVVAGKVLTCEKHPNADRLSLTTVDVGGSTPLQIVCGAPNVAADQTVWVATVGTVLYPAAAEEPLKISKAKVRGETSEGMICAEDELGLGEDHAGIMVLPDEVQKGTLASDYYHVTTDDIIEIELTPNRSDALCHIGVAADLAAWSQVHGPEVSLKLPVVPDTLPVKGDVQIKVDVLNPEACPRYCGLTISGISVQDSPDWLQNRLRTIGVKPINNVVDATNFVLHEMGQPLHAFDAEKISNAHIIVQTLPEKTPFIALDGTEYKLTSTDLMICDGANKGMCIGGVYGGLGSGITDSTKTVFLESAHFNPRWIRRTSQYHDLRTDAARTFEKSTDPNVCRRALLRAAALICELSGGVIASEVIDIYPKPVKKTTVAVRWEMIRKLTGAEITEKQVLEILGALQMDVIGKTHDHVTVAVPTNKADVTRESDVIEEILRIYGYDHVEIRSKIEIPLIPQARTGRSALRDALGNFLAARGFLETMALSMIESRHFNAGPLAVPNENRVLINNTSNVHLDLMRHTMLASALESARFNQNRMQNDLMLYEIGNTYQRSGSQIHEEEHLTLSMTGDALPKGWRMQNQAADFFSLKKHVQLVLGYLGITAPEVQLIRDDAWDFAQRYLRDGREICTFGRVARELAEAYDLRHSLYFADFRVSSLLEFSGDKSLVVSDISRFPAVLRDIAIVLPSDVVWRTVEEVIASAGGELLLGFDLFDVYENPGVLGEGNRSLAIALTFQHPSRTLTDEEVNKAVDRIVKALAKETGATLR